MNSPMPATDSSRTPPVNSTPAGVDGRALRRERGRAAVTDAMIDLVSEGHLPPSAEQVAARAGVSVASVFRYFESLDDLRRAATEVYFRRYDYLFEIPAVGDGTLSERIERVVHVRIRLYSVARRMGQLVRVRAHNDAIAHDNLGRLRQTYVDQLRHHFDTELSAITTDEQHDLVGSIATLTSFESWEQLGHHLGRSDDQIRRAWTRVLTQLIPTP